MDFQRHSAISTGVHNCKMKIGHANNSHRVVIARRDNSIRVVVVRRAKNSARRGSGKHRGDNLVPVVKQASRGCDAKLFADFSCVRYIGVAAFVEFAGRGLPVWEQRNVSGVVQNPVLSNHNPAIVSYRHNAGKGATMVIGGTK